MTDKELLELAAKAAGLNVRQSQRWAETTVVQVRLGDGTLNWIRWNPLTDDGDALRLAVKLNLTCRFYSGNACAQATTPGGPSAYEDVTNNDDPLAGARLAITRAAASIGAKGNADAQ